jgi:aspartate/methionine/tyrosine aminotransferase
MVRPAERASDPELFDEMAFSQRAVELEAASHHVVQLCFSEPDFGTPPAMRGPMDGRPLPYTPALGLPAPRQAIVGKSLVHVARARITEASIHDGSKHD